MTGIEAVLVDLDGTVLDTTRLILDSFHYAFREGLGETVSDAELLEHFGKTLDDQFAEMRPGLSPSEVDRLVGLYRAFNHAEHDRLVTVIPGADAVLAQLHRQGRPLGVVTSKRLDIARHGLERFGLWPLFGVVVHHESTRRHKPHPEPVRLALATLGVNPARTVFIGDSPYDMLAGRAAGCRALGYLFNTFDRQRLVEAGAERVMESWEDIEKWLGQDPI